MRCGVNTAFRAQSGNQIEAGDTPTMNVLAVIAGLLGFGVAAYAAMETDPEDLLRRTGYGILGLALLVLGIMYL